LRPLGLPDCPFCHTGAEFAGRANNRPRASRGVGTLLKSLIPLSLPQNPTYVSCWRLEATAWSATAFDQCNAEFVFQLLDLPAERRLRDAQQLRRAREVTLAGHRSEVPELA